MMITHYALHYKNRVLQIFLVIALALFCFAFAKNIKTITDDISPLSSGNVEAMFYIENPDTGSMTCIGDGLINTNTSIDNAEIVKSAIVTSPNYSAFIGPSMEVKWDSIKYSNNTYNVYGKIVQIANTKGIVFPTITEMIAANLSSGDQATTEGYYSRNDNGGASYYIDSTYTSPMTDIRLHNGLIAHLNYSPTLNVASIGIFPEQDCSKRLNEALRFFEGKISTLQFNDGNYIFENQVWLKSLNIVGTGNTNFSISSNFNPLAKRIFLTDLSRHDIKYKLNIENINFYYLTSSNHALKDSETILVALSDIESCTIKNCKFIASHSENDKTFMKCDLLWFQESSSSNINIINCDFKNNTASGIISRKDIPNVGGCLWFSGSDSMHSTLQHIQIKDCNFTTTCSDEAIAFWKCVADDITITHCNINLFENYSNNLLAFFNGNFNNINLNNCNFNISGSAACIVKFRDFKSDSVFTFNRCNFNNNCQNSIIDMNAVIYTNENIENDFINKNIIFNECNFVDSTNKQSFSYIINDYGGKNYNYLLSGSNINMTLNKSMLSIGATSNCTITTNNSEIDTSSKLSNATNVSEVDFIYKGNTIHSDFTNQFNQSATGTLTFVDNVCKSSGTLALDNCTSTEINNDNLTVDNNTFESSYTLIKKIR
ncbi:hypothetical protein [Pseudobutyrivibrio ruminis]|uniref:hypothetical protein n=1 Tax=Pseudobutyrivibrio ruminis TaxID=46206 RepID=UPI0004090D26|nr:hypothetical protein [Pseudobutyrivibrio ruminis]